MKLTRIYITIVFVSVLVAFVITAILAHVTWALSIPTAKTCYMGAYPGVSTCPGHYGMYIACVASIVGPCACIPQPNIVGSILSCSKNRLFAHQLSPQFLEHQNKIPVNLDVPFVAVAVVIVSVAAQVVVVPVVVVVAMVVVNCMWEERVMHRCQLLKQNPEHYCEQPPHPQPHPLNC